MVNRWMGLALGLAALATASCSSGALEPQPLALDAVNCARCGMMISDARHAAQAVAPGQDPRFYDDRGCLAEDAPELPAGARLFVEHDAGSGWIDVHDAFFAVTSDARTPMGHGLTAFRSSEEAARADRNGRALSWNDVLVEVRR